MRTKTTAPLYKQLFEDLKEQLDNRQYKIGDLLPSENDLCKLYNTTRPTVRQALAALSNLGYINRQHGKGSIVAEPKKGLGILSIKGVTAGFGENQLKTSLLQKQVAMPWPAPFFFDLTEPEQAAGCIFFSRLRVVDQRPILFEETYIGNHQLPRFTGRNLEDRSLFKILQDHYDIEVKGGEQKIWAITASKQLSELLQLKPNSPIVHMKRKLQTNRKEVNIYSSLYCNTDNFFLQDYF
ncbi:MAG: GntR family transcriptional regulator [Candidatus Pseudobacter hemicellulosilyticus]|uniref:GntR family transcriptional regulator n=1 Tax=Candidatus Pseudobacter hemicellulosilyticus TaxID=3121375 RepID=A0AAJ5WUS8_9BACT|nr:MAG: GntR family transcriptional regulator [Pseudobacter sp.]